MHSARDPCCIASGNSHLEEAWKQRATPPVEQQGADAGNGGLSEDTIQHQAKAEPEPPADVPAIPEDSAALHQSAEEQPTVSTDPAVQLPPDADEPNRLPDAAVPQHMPGDVPDEERPSAAVDDADAADASAVSPAAAPAASGSDAIKQPAIPDTPGEPADARAGVLLLADTAATEAPAGPTGEPSVSPPSDELGESEAAEEPAAGATDPAPAVADGMMLPANETGDVGAASGQGVSSGMLGLQPEGTDADGQPDARDPDGSPAGRNPGAAEGAVTDGAAVAPNAEPAAIPPPTDGGEEGGTLGASGSEQAVPPMPATAEERSLKSPDRQPAALPNKAAALSDSQVDETEQPPVPPADLPVRHLVP